MILIISADNDTVTDTICNWLLFQKKKFIRINSSQPIADIHFDFVHDLFYISVDQKKIDLYNMDLNIKDLDLGSKKILFFILEFFGFQQLKKKSWITSLRRCGKSFNDTDFLV